MMTSTALLKIPRILPLDQLNTQSLAPVMLFWRQNFLLIKPASGLAPKQTEQILPALQNRQWFEYCLRYSPVKAVRLDMLLGEDTLRDWADACDRTGKRTFIHLPSASCLPRIRAPWRWGLKRLADWLVAASLLVCLSPVLFLLIILTRLDSPGPIFFRQWKVGDRGQLFQIFKFRTKRHGAKKRRRSLDKLPQLLNVLRGEMSLVGPRPLDLHEAFRLSPNSQKRLNALPGLISWCQVKMRDSNQPGSNQPSLEIRSQVNLNYLRNWSLKRDLWIILLAIPKGVSSLIFP